MICWTPIYCPWSELGFTRRLHRASAFQLYKPSWSIPERPPRRLWIPVSSQPLSCWAPRHGVKISLCQRNLDSRSRRSRMWRWPWFWAGKETNVWIRVEKSETRPVSCFVLYSCIQNNEMWVGLVLVSRQSLNPRWGIMSAFNSFWLVIDYQTFGIVLAQRCSDKSAPTSVGNYRSFRIVIVIQRM